MIDIAPGFSALTLEHPGYSTHIIFWMCGHFASSRSTNKIEKVTRILVLSTWFAIT